MILDFRFWIVDWEISDALLEIKNAATVETAAAFLIEMRISNETNPQSKI